MTNANGSSGKIRLALLAREPKKSKTATATCSEPPRHTSGTQRLVTFANGYRMRATYRGTLATA
jgi:hypothetical protein